MAILIKPDGTKENVTGKTFSEFQELVGGYIETLSTNNGKIMLINEDGKNLGLEPNEFATMMVKLQPSDFIVGNAIIVTLKELED